MATKNIVPNANGEGEIGTSSKYWSSAYLDGLNIGNDAAANLVFTPSASDTITLASAANGAFTITTVDAAAAAANVGFVVDGNFTVSNVTSTITSSSSDITTFATTNATSGYTEFAYNTSTVAGYIGNGTSLLSGAANTDFIMRSESGAIKFTTGGGNLALTIDSSQNATFAGKSDITTSVSGFASTITNNKDDSQGVLIRTSDNDGGEYILDLQSSSSATGTDYASKFNVAKGGNATFAGNVGIGDSAFNYYANSLVVKAADEGGVTFLSSATNAKFYLAFADGTTNHNEELAGMITFDHNNNQMALGGNAGVEHIKIANDGDVTVTDGDLIIGTAGKGIDFSAQTPTSVGGASNVAEVLDHYEEGTWTPAVQGQSTAGNWTYSFRTGEYTRIGNQVYISGSIRATVSSGDNAAGSCRIINLPFTSENTANHNTGIQPAAGYASHIYLTVSPNTNFILVGRMDQSGITTALAEAQFNATNGLSQSEFQMFFDFTYTVPT